MVFAGGGEGSHVPCCSCSLPSSMEGGFMSKFVGNMETFDEDCNC